jgi:hypothetical protein
MNRYLKTALLGLSLWALSLGPALAAQRIALVIGNAAYTGEKSLRNPLNDAADVSAALRAQGFVVQPHTNLGRQDMNRAIERFLSSAEGAELALVYYSGHGMQSAGETFFIPTDARIQSERDVRSEGVRLNELMDDLESRRIRKTVLIVDACRDNPYATRTRSTSRGLGRPKEMNGAFLVAYATADGQTADDGEGRNGTYTAQLLQQLSSQPASRNLRDLLEDTQLAVERASNRQQRPKLYGDTAKFRDVYLASVVPEPVTRPLPTVDAEQAQWTAALRANSEAGYAGYLSAYPAGQYAVVARNALAALKPVQPAPSPVQAVQTLSPSPSPSPALIEGRYQILAGGSEVKDVQTGLTWARCSVGHAWNGSTCAGQAKTFTFDQAQQQAGNGWRVPTVRELHSLVWCSTGKTSDQDDPKDGKGSIANLCDGDFSRPTIRAAAFPQPAGFFWSSSPYVGGSSNAWSVSFNYGYVYYNDRYNHGQVRLVRASQ